MPRRISLSQWKSEMQRAINKYNNQVRKYIGEVNNAIRKYNQQVNQYNSTVRSNRQKLINAINAYNRSATPKVITYSVEYNLRTSLDALGTSYRSLEIEAEPFRNTARQNLLIDFPQNETANSYLLYDSLNGYDNEDFETNESLGTTAIETQLVSISPELEKRWKGALYSLHPSNPDAARHFCTSVREIFIKILDLRAPDQEVLQFPGCQLHNDGKPNRRSKIKYIMAKKSIGLSSFETFMDSDINNLLDLFRSLNDGTHGHSGTFGTAQLLRLKKRVEDSLIFLTAFSN